MNERFKNLSGFEGCQCHQPEPQGRSRHDRPENLPAPPIWTYLSPEVLCKLDAKNASHHLEETIAPGAQLEWSNKAVSVDSISTGS
jgi:hypothetical protein